MQQQESQRALNGDEIMSIRADENADGLKDEVRQQLWAAWDFRRPRDQDRARLAAMLPGLIELHCAEHNVWLTGPEREVLARELLDDSHGFGPLETWLRDPETSAVFINGPDEIYVQRGHQPSARLPTRFLDRDHLLRVLDSLLASAGHSRGIHETTIRARLPGVGLLHAVFPPLAPNGPVVTIRRQTDVLPGLEEILRQKNLAPEMLMLLEASVKARLNIVVCGLPHSGKSMLVNTLCGFIPPGERVGILEDDGILAHGRENAARFQPSNEKNTLPRDATGTARLLRGLDALVLDRLVVDLHQTDAGAELLRRMAERRVPTVTSVDADHPRDALNRLERQAAAADPTLTAADLQERLGSAIDLILHLEQQQDGRRVLVAMVAIHFGGYAIQMQEIFRYRPSKPGVLGQFEATGQTPAFVHRLLNQAIRLPEHFFAERVLKNSFT